MLGANGQRLPLYSAGYADVGSLLLRDNRLVQRRTRVPCCSVDMRPCCSADCHSRSLRLLALFYSYVPPASQLHRCAAVCMCAR